MGLDPSIYRRARAWNGEASNNVRGARDAQVKPEHDGTERPTVKMRITDVAGGTLPQGAGLAMAPLPLLAAMGA